MVQKVPAVMALSLQPLAGAVTRTQESKNADTINARDFGVKADGVTDDTLALRAAIDSMPYGGICFLPQGRIRLTDEIMLHAGITVIGAGAADFLFGSPPAYASNPTMLCQETPGKACLRIGGGMHSIVVKNMAFSPTVNPVYPGVETPVADGKCGILLSSSTRVTPPIPVNNGHSWNLRLEELMFYNLEFGIKVIDPLSTGDTGAGDYPYDWSMAPAILVNLRFVFPKNGIYFSTSNADAWVMIGCFFGVPSGGNGVTLHRWGMLHFINCFAGGQAVSGNRFIRVIPNGTQNGVEDIILDNCQAETLTQFIALEGEAVTIYKFAVVLRDCVAELGSDIYLGMGCNLVSTRNRFDMNVYVAHADVTVDSLFDNFIGPNQFSFLVGALTTNVNTLLSNKNSPVYANYQILEGRLTVFSTAAPVSGNWQVGNRVVRSPPVVGQPKAWSCTVAGTPGTWVSEGNL